MKLIELNKLDYRQQLNKVSIGFVVVFALLALIFGQLLIAIMPAQSEGNFSLNLFGVVLALVLTLSLLNWQKRHPFLANVYYVWQLKQWHNQVYRRLKTVEAAANDNDAVAVDLLRFYYLSLEKVYMLDDNTLTIDSVRKKRDDYQEKARALNLSPQLESFDTALINNYKD